MAGSLLKGLSPEIMVMIMQQLPDFDSLRCLLAADPELGPLHACYQQSTDMAVAKNEVGPSQWSSVCTLIALQSPYRQPPGASSVSSSTAFTPLEVYLLKEILGLRSLWYDIAEPIFMFNLGYSIPSDSSLYRFWTLLWACVPEAKYFNGKLVRDSKAKGEPRVEYRLTFKVFMSTDAMLKKPEYMRWHSKIEKFFEVYQSGGEEGKQELSELFEITQYSLISGSLAMPALTGTMQVPGGLEDGSLEYMLIEIVEVHIRFVANLLEVDLESED
jgi:hypothetical protein